MATTLGPSGSPVTLASPSFEREGYTRHGEDVGIMHKMADGGKVKIRGTGAATKGIYARGPMA